MPLISNVRRFEVAAEITCRAETEMHWRRTSRSNRSTFGKMAVTTKTIRKSFLWLLIGIFVVGIASAIVLWSQIKHAIQVAVSGHGLGTYNTPWLVEFNSIGALVLVASIGIVLLVGAIFRIRTYLEVKALERKYGVLEPSA